jgi:hypothetical protein
MERSEMTLNSLKTVVLTALVMLAPVGQVTAENSLGIVPGTTELAFDKAPDEAKTLLNAIAGALRGETAIDAFGPVTFEDPVLQNLHNIEPFDYAGLSVTNFQIRLVQIDEATDSKTVAGIIHWFDEDTKLSAATSFGVVYRPIGGTLFIHDLRVAPVPPSQPRIALVLVPKDRIRGTLEASGSFPDLLRLALENGIRLEDTQDGGIANYAVLAFSLDRLARGDRLDLLLNLRKNAEDTREPLRPPFQKLLDYSGYQVAVMEMGLDLSQPDPLRVEVYYTPTRMHPTLSPEPHLAGQYTLTGGN